MYKINFNHLYYFLTITQEGSIVKASKKLHISQPALSKQLKQLEDDLGENLFDRKGRRLVLNECGAKVKSYAMKIFRNSEEMIHQLKQPKDNSLKIIKIGVVPWIPVQMTLNFIRPLLASSHIRLQVFQKELDLLIEETQNQELDLILCDSPYSGRSKILHGKRIFTEKIVCVSSARTKQKLKFPDALNTKEIITYPQATMLADKINDFLYEAGIQAQTHGEFSDSSLAKEIIKKSNFLGFFPLCEVQDEVKHKELKILGELEKQKISLWAITHKKHPEKSLINKLIYNKK